MNVFVLDDNPLVAAALLYDKHRHKMLLEAAQLVCNYVNEKHPGLSWTYRSTHTKHPWSIAVRESYVCREYLLVHALALSAAYYVATDGRIHKSSAVIAKAVALQLGKPFELKGLDEYASERYYLEKAPKCVDNEFKFYTRTVDAYTQYYIKGKAHLATYGGKAIDPKEFYTHKVLTKTLLQEEGLLYFWGYGVEVDIARFNWRFFLN